MSHLKSWVSGGILILAAAIGAQGGTAAPQDGDLAALKLEVARLKGVVPDQAHAMSDVGAHFTNL